MALGKPIGKSSGTWGFGLNRNFTPHGPEKADGDGTCDPAQKRDLLSIPSDHKTLIGMPAVGSGSSKPPADPVAANTSSVSTSAMAAIDVPASAPANIVRASDLFFKLVDARPQIARLCDFLNDPVAFDDQFREFCSNPAFLREVSFWLNNRIVMAQFIPNGPIEDGWLFIEALENKPEIFAEHGLLSVNLKKITGSDPLVRIGTIKPLHLRRIIPHNMSNR